MELISNITIEQFIDEKVEETIDIENVDLDELKNGFLIYLEIDFFQWLNDNWKSYLYTRSND